MTPEIHLVILWSNGRHTYDSVLARLQEKFTVLDVAEITWSADLFSQNIQRFYGQHLPPGCDKERVSGTGPFVAFIIRDDAPAYGHRVATRGDAIVNTNIFDVKKSLRAETDGFCLVHATDNVSEANHDLALLYGISAAQAAERYTAPWDGAVRQVQQDLVGAHGWNSMEQLLFTLNHTVRYVVLRNFECLPAQYTLQDHGDIDMLTEDYQQIMYVANAAPVFTEPYRIHCRAKLADTDVLFDFRYVGDDYYDRAWEADILATRVMAAGGFYIPNPEQHFYALLYHALLHKPALGADYAARLQDLGAAALKMPALKIGRTSGIALLSAYMRRQHYKVTKPIDLSVQYNPADMPVELLSAPPDNRLVHHAAALEQSLSAIKNSTSWRLTAPLRWLKTKLAG